MDGISLIDASILYSLLLSPLLSMVLLCFWVSVNMKKTAKAQLLGIVVLLALGFLAINSPIILIIHATAIILLVVWIFAYRAFFPERPITYHFAHLCITGCLLYTILCIHRVRV